MINSALKITNIPMKAKQELLEIKKGDTGHGLLIENDGYVTLSEGTGNKRIVESINEADGWFVPKPFIVDAVFQKYGIKNANGRIYPEGILKREVEKYQQRIRERRAIGECYTPDVLILTETGWKTLADVQEGENIYTLNPYTNEIQINPILGKVEYDFNGDMIHLIGDGIDDVVTPKHGFPITNGAGDFLQFMTADEIANTKEFGADAYIPNGPKWTDDIDEWIDSNSKENNSYTSCNSIKAFKEPYNGKVMCVEVENHIWFVNSNGLTHWTKNCNHPSESTIDLSRVSHNIIELHWEGRTLVGKMELNITEGFRRHGIVTSCGDQVANLLLNGYKIGVSSRAVGSVEERMGVMMVGDNLDLICWDVVADPSTPNAYISVNGEEELRPYYEAKEQDQSKSALNEKIAKMKAILM